MMYTSFSTRIPGCTRLTILACILLMCLVTVTANAEQSVSVSHVDGEFYDPVQGSETDGRCLMVDQQVVFHIHVTNTDHPECFWMPMMAFEINDNGTGGTWDWPSTNPDECLFRDEILFIDTASVDPLVCDTAWFDRGGLPYAEGGHKLFLDVFRMFADADGEGCDSIGFAGINVGPIGLYHGMDNDALQLVVTPRDVGSVICLDRVLSMQSYEWEWNALAVVPSVICPVNKSYPDWGGPYCYTITECCWMFSGGDGVPLGLTGNTNCGMGGKITLSDITTLIDRVYISKNPLCCEAQGNTDGSEGGLITLADITRLVDYVYISKSPTAYCP